MSRFAGESLSGFDMARARAVWTRSPPPRAAAEGALAADATALGATSGAGFLEQPAVSERAARIADMPARAIGRRWMMGNGLLLRARVVRSMPYARRAPAVSVW